MLLTQSCNSSDNKLDLDRLLISNGPGFEPEKVALPGTRLGVLEKARTWINGEDTDENSDSRALLLLGKAGVGKSAIAHRLVQEYRQLRRLGAFFRFSSSANVGPENFFRTIARRIADLDPSYATALMDFTDSTLNTTTSPILQLTELLTKPFKTLSALGTIVIVVDALDECPADHRLELIQCLHENILLFPKNIRFIFTSRPSEAHYLRSYPWVLTLDLESDTTVDDDIFQFVKSKLVYPATRHPLSGFDDSRLSAIVTSAEHLFQYAAVVCKEIVDAEHHHRESPFDVYTRLVTSGSQGLDGLYLNILHTAFSASPRSQLEGFHRVMGWILHSQDHLLRQMLIEFESAQVPKQSFFLTASALPDQDQYGLVPSILRPLGALLSGTEGSKDKVFPLHSSFRDFLLEEARSKQFCIGPELIHHINFTTTSLNIMQQELHFNMAFLESSYVFNSDVPDFEERVSTGVSETLAYVCAYWVAHLKMSCMTETQLMEVMKIHYFVESSTIIFWLEVLALKKKIHLAEESLYFLAQWTNVSCNQHIVWKMKFNAEQTLKNRETFIRWTKLVHYCHSMIEAAIPHLYLSGLPLFTQENKKEGIAFTGILSIPSEKVFTAKQEMKGILHGHENDVNSAAFSPDGTRIVSASNDKTVRIWDAQTGTQIGQPLTGHDSSVNSAAFSPDGSRIVSASADKTVCIWDAKNAGNT